MFKKTQKDNTFNYNQHVFNYLNRIKRNKKILIYFIQKISKQDHLLIIKKILRRIILNSQKINSH